MEVDATITLRESIVSLYSVQIKPQLKLAAAAQPKPALCLRYPKTRHNIVTPASHGDSSAWEISHAALRYLPRRTGTMEVMSTPLTSTCFDVSLDKEIPQ
jgi:hypothetical protein